MQLESKNEQKTKTNQTKTKQKHKKQAYRQRHTQGLLGNGEAVLDIHLSFTNDIINGALDHVKQQVPLWFFTDCVNTEGTKTTDRLRMLLQQQKTTQTYLNKEKLIMGSQQHISLHLR